MKEKHIAFLILLLLSWFIGYEVFEALRGTYEVIRYAFVYGYTVFSLFIFAAVFIPNDKKEE